MGRNNAAFHGVTFAYRGMTEMEGFGPNDPAPQAHLFTAHKDGKQVGRLKLQEYGTIDIIEVEPEHQRQGIATGLYNFAKDHAVKTNGKTPWPQHSTIRSPEGQAWAKSTKEKLPPNEAS